MTWRDSGQMKTIETDGITYIEPLAGAAGEWYYGMDYEHGDLYEAEILFKEGRPVRGRKLCLVRYPDGELFFPVPKAAGTYSERPVFLDGMIYILNVDFNAGAIRIVRFDCGSHETGLHAELPLASVKDCYNLSLQTAPLTLSRQCAAKNEFEIVWPQRRSFHMDDHDSFFMRDGGRLFFNRWHESGEGADYKYWEETVVKDLDGNTLEIIPGDVTLMPGGEIWNLW